MPPHRPLVVKTYRVDERTAEAFRHHAEEHVGMRPTELIRRLIERELAKCELCRRRR